MSRPTALVPPDLRHLERANATIETPPCPRPYEESSVLGAHISWRDCRHCRYLSRNTGRCEPGPSRPSLGNTIEELLRPPGRRAVRRRDDILSHSSPCARISNIICPPQVRCPNEQCSICGIQTTEQSHERRQVRPALHDLASTAPPAHTTGSRSSRKPWPRKRSPAETQYPSLPPGYYPQRQISCPGRTRRYGTGATLVLGGRASRRELQCPAIHVSRKRAGLAYLILRCYSSPL